MRTNFSGNKRRKEELRKKKQEEKRMKRLNKRAQAALPETPQDSPSADSLNPTASPAPLREAGLS
jgi:hypothetical protein